MLIFLLSLLFGFGFLGIIPKSINSTLKLLICPAVGIFFLTELSIFYSFIFGVNIFSIAGAIASEGLISFLAFKRYSSQIKIEKLSYVFNISSLVIFAISAYIFYTQVLLPTPTGLQAGGGGLYGDTALHLAYTARIQTGQFPPQNPLYAGKILVYPLANDLLSSILRINGLAINFAFILPQIVFLIAFIALFYAVVRKFTSDKGYLISVLLFFCGWGIGFIYFLKELVSGGKIGSLLLTEYTNNPNYNLYFHNVFTGLILPERSFLPGLFLGLWIFLNFFEFFATNNKLFLLLNSILIGTLPFWHVHTFIFFSIVWFIFSISYLRKDANNLTTIIFLSIISLIISSPFLYLFLTNHSANSFLRFTIGWENEGKNLLIFWLKNSYLILLLAVLGFRKIINNFKFYFVAPFITFLVANTIIFQPWDWDNIKLLSWSFLFFSILAGIFLSSIFEKNYIFKIIVIIVIFTSCLSGALSITSQIRGRFILYDNSDIQLANWVKENSKKDDIFLIDPAPNHPIPSLAGRLVYLGYPGHLWVHGIDYTQRQILNKMVLAGEFSSLKDSSVPISYVVFSKQDSFNYDLNYEVVFENGKYTVVKNFFL